MNVLRLNVPMSALNQNYEIVCDFFNRPKSFVSIFITLPISFLLFIHVYFSIRFKQFTVSICVECKLFVRLYQKYINLTLKQI